MENIVSAGYALLVGAVDPGIVRELRSSIAMAVSQRGDGIDVRAGTEWIRDATVLGPSVATLGQMRDVASAVSQLIGADPAMVNAVMRNPVGETAQQALHVDWAGPIHPGADQQVQVMFYLDDVAADNGPTRLVPGSHRSSSTPSKRFADPRARHPEQVLITASSGDALVFSSHLWHGGTGNRSGRPRRVITVTYRRSG